LTCDTGGSGLSGRSGAHFHSFSPLLVAGILCVTRLSGSSPPPAGSQPDLQTKPAKLVFLTFLGVLELIFIFCLTCPACYVSVRRQVTNYDTGGSGLSGAHFYFFFQPS